MRFFQRKSPSRLFAIGALTAALMVVQAFEAPGDKTKPSGNAKPGKAEIVKPHVKTTFDHAVVDIVKKKALAFKAIEMHDPKTGKKVAADFMVTTPNGKKVTAKAYFDELNKFEKHLNTLGHSIRDKEEKVVLSRNRVDAAELEKKAKAIAGSHLRFNAKTMKAAPKHADLPTQFKAKAELDAGRVEAMKKYLAAGPAGDPKTDTVPISHLDDAKGGASGGTVKQWSHELGNRKIVGASMTARLVTKGGQDNVSVLGSVEADAYLANKQLELLRATASANVGKTGPGKASVTVSIAGRTVYNKALSVNSDAHKADQLSKTFDQGVSFRFSLGPIPMSVKMGASGSMGIRYFVGVRPLSLQAQFVPFAHVKAYAQCGIDAVVASVGVRANLQVIDFEMTIGGSLVVKFDSSSGASLQEHAYVLNNLEMLKGELAIYAEIGVWIFKKHYEHDFFKFKGFKTSGYLVNVNRTTRITGGAAL